MAKGLTYFLLVTVRIFALSFGIFLCVHFNLVHFDNEVSRSFPV